MPQTGPDLVSAGYPTSNALTALLGGTANAVVPDVPVKSNYYFGLGALIDQAGPASGLVLSAPVPVVPGDVITKISFPTGATGTNTLTTQWAALYAGTGSAPGTAGAQPALIAQSASAASVAASNLLTFSFASPVTITSVQAPYGYVYAAFSGTATGNPSFISMTAGSVVAYPWFVTSPVFWAATHNSAVGSAAPGSMSVATRVANPPVVLLY